MDDRRFGVLARAGRAREQHRAGLPARRQRDVRGRLRPAHLRADRRRPGAGREAPRVLEPGAVTATRVGPPPPAFVDVGSVDTFREEVVDYATRMWRGGGAGAHDV